MAVELFRKFGLRSGVHAAASTYGRGTQRESATRERSMNYYAAVRAFLTTSEAGSFSVAAKRLSVKASTVSHYVSDLEEKLGGPLFSRSTRGVILTERGAKFRGFAQRAVNALDEALATASSFRSEHVDVKRPIPRRRKRKVC